MLILSDPSNPSIQPTHPTLIAPAIYPCLAYVHIIINMSYTPYLCASPQHSYSLSTAHVLHALATHHFIQLLPKDILSFVPPLHVYFFPINYGNLKKQTIYIFTKWNASLIATYT
jgi:hypothetical protein